MHLDIILARRLSRVLQIIQIPYNALLERGPYVPAQTLLQSHSVDVV